MSKRKKVQEPKLDTSGQCGANNQTVGLAVLQGHGTYEHILFIDRNSEISKTDVKKLEGAGFRVVLITGTPHQCIGQYTRYNS